MIFGLIKASAWYHSYVLSAVRTIILNCHWFISKVSTITTCKSHPWSNCVTGWFLSQRIVKIPHSPGCSSYIRISIRGIFDSTILSPLHACQFLVSYLASTAVIQQWSSPLPLVSFSFHNSFETDAIAIRAYSKKRIRKLKFIEPAC